MLPALLTLPALAAAPLPAWDAPTWGTRAQSDTRLPDVHEARVFLTAFCRSQPDCTVEFLPLGQNGTKVPAANRRVPINVAYGSFTRPGAREVLMTLCFAQSDSCDGTTLLRHEGGRWKAIHHTAGVYPSECLKFRRFDDRDQLACRNNGMVMFGSTLRLIRADGKRTVQKDLLPDGSANCEPGAPRPVQVTRLGDWHKQDVNGDGRPDLVVEVYRYRLHHRAEECLPREPIRVEGERVVRRWGM